jgi:hypothetical protein
MTRRHLVVVVWVLMVPGALVAQATNRAPLVASIDSLANGPVHAAVL